MDSAESHAAEIVINLLKMKTVSVIVVVPLLVGCPMTKSVKLLQLPDSLGIVTSSLCLLHCLALPVLVLALPTFSHLAEHDDQTHFWLVGWVLIFACLALIAQTKHRKNSSVIALMSLGLSAVLIATFATTLGLSQTLELPLITIGNAMVIGAHHLNRKSRCCS
jgi:hypothetical protein